MEFLQAATCADELEELWKRTNEDEEEVDPLGCVLEISGHDESVLNPRGNETSIVPAGVNVEMSEEEAAGKAPEISPEEGAADSSSRLSATRLFLQRIYSKFWEPTLQDRQTGKILDSTKGYPGEGPISGGPDLPTKGIPWIPEDHPDMVVAKQVDRSSNQGVVEDTTTEKILGALWWKGYRAGCRRLCRANVSGPKVGAINLPIKSVRKAGVTKPFLKKSIIRGSAQHGSGAGGKPIIEVVRSRPGFPAVLDTSNTDSTWGEGNSSQVHDNVHVEQDRPMERYEAERLEKRKRGICYWFSRGKDNCKFGEDCKFIHSKDDVVLQSYWRKYFVAGRYCFASEGCKFSRDTAGVRCIQFYQSGRCRHGDKCVFEHGDPLGGQRPRSPRTPPRDSPRRGTGRMDGGRKGSPERFDEDEEDLMVYDDDTRMMELLMEAISYMSDGKSDLARAEADPVFKLLKFNGNAEQMDAEWCSWTSGMLSSLELHEIVKPYETPLEDVEEWINDLRIWFQRATLEEGSDTKRGKKRSLERESLRTLLRQKRH